jgi:hypothetical protein
MADRTFDARPDRVDFRDIPYRPPLQSLPPRYPDDAQLARWLPAYVRAGLVRDQGTEGACTGFGLACVVNYLLWVRHVESRSRRVFRSVSPRMLYELARRYDEWPGEDYDGSSSRGALKGWHKHGVCSEPLWPYDLDTDGHAVFTEPARGWEADALSRTLGVYYRVDRSSIVDVQAAIVNIGAVYASAHVHTGWDELTQTRRRAAPASHADVPDIPLPARSGRLGGHAFALVGYDARGFIVQNSWGPGWGAGGFGRVSYDDWASHATDVWACALGVPAEPSQARVEATRWRIPSGRGAGQVARVGRASRNPADDPWPIDREFIDRRHEPLGTATAYAHALVTGNDGILCVRDLVRGGDNAHRRHAQEIVFTRPRAWFHGRPTGAAKVAIYAHGGLNDEDEAIRRVRVLAPYFLTNDIYPIFLTWRTGIGETIGSLIGDWIRRIPGFDLTRDTWFGEWLADQKDRAIESIGRPFGRGIWGEMRENAERGMETGHGIDLLVRNLARLARGLAEDGRTLELHLVGHSAGATLLGHVLEHVLAVEREAIDRIASCTLFAPACSVRFANQHYVAASAAGLLPIERLWIECLSDENEKRDGLPSPSVGLYGKSLLYLVSRALDDTRKIPLLGLARAHEPKYASDTDQWAGSHLPDVRTWQRTWRARGGARRTGIVIDSAVRYTKENDRVQATHGSFDNNIDVLSAMLRRIRGKELEAEIEDMGGG